MAKIRGGNPDRTPSPVWRCDNDKSGTAPQAFRQNCKPLAEKRMPRIRDRDHAPQSLEDCIILRWSAIPLTPTRSSTASFTTPTASSFPARVYAAPAANGPRRLDRTSSPVRQNPSASEPRQPGGIIPLRWATSFRNPRRHYPVTPGRLRRNPHIYFQGIGLAPAFVRSL